MCKHLTCTSLCPLTYNQDLQKQRLYHQFSQGGIQFSKGKNAMWKGWLNPNLLLLRSVVVYNILSLTECRWLFPRGKPVPNAYMGRWPWRWKSWFLGALPRKYFCKIKVQSGKSASESSQGKKKKKCHTLRIAFLLDVICHKCFWISFCCVYFTLPSCTAFYSNSSWQYISPPVHCFSLYAK